MHMHMYTDLMNSLLVLQCTELVALSQRLGESLSIAIKEYVNHTDIICGDILIHMCSVLYVVLDLLKATKDDNYELQVSCNQRVLLCTFFLFHDM